jgi:hypothetical protein
MRGPLKEDEEVGIELISKVRRLLGWAYFCLRVL